MGKKVQTKLPSHSGHQRLIRSIARKRDVFPFLQLPVELRLQIYENALPKAKKHPRPRNSCNETGVLCLYEKDRTTKSPRGFVALMTTNQMVYQETLKVLYGIPPRGRSPMVKLHVGDNFIRMKSYNFFCSKHHVFDKGIQSIFAHFRHTELHVHAYCSPFPDDSPSIDDPGPDDRIEMARQRCLRDNVRWVASKLRSAKSLSRMVIEQDDQDFYDWCGCYGECIVDKLEFLLSPLKAITSLDQVSYGRYGLTGGYCECTMSDVIIGSEAWDGGFPYRLKMRMTSKEPVKDEPELFNLYDDFICKLKKCELSGTRIDTEGLIENAQDFREQGNVKSFNSILDKFANELQEEVEQKIALCDEVKSLKGKAIEIGEVETEVIE